MAPQPTTLALRATTLLSSALLTGLSIAALSYSGLAFKRLVEWFPQDKYVWYGASGIPGFDAPKQPNTPRPDYHLVMLYYDWSTENFIWVAAGSSVVAGILGLVGSGLAILPKSSRPSTTKNALTLSSMLFAALAFFASLVSSIYVFVHRMNVRATTCHFSLGEKPFAQLDGQFTCTRELAACDILPFLVRRNEEQHFRACDETRTSREILIPLTVFSGVLVGAYAVQWYLTRGRASSGISADERVERLQRESAE